MRKVPIGILFFLFVFLLFWRYQVSATRFFDVDEFSYMHWAAQVARAEKPYTDFFSYFTPGFMWVMAPIFWVVGRTGAVFTAGRAVSYVIFLSILSVLSYLWGITRGWKWALLPAVILAFLPMPYDKFLEIRPDNLATLLALLGVIGEIGAIRGKKSLWFVSGLLFSASLFVLVKTLPIVVVGGCIALFSSRKNFVFFCSGLFGPWVLFFLGAAIRGHFGQVWYSLTQLPFEVYRSSRNYFMEPDLFFFPNASFYGGNGDTITSGLIANHAVWIGAALVGVYRLVTSTNKTALLLSFIYVVLVIGYVKFSPARHSQYLIPIAVFVAYYAADGLVIFFDWLARVGGYGSLIITLVGLGYLLVVVTQEVNTPKLFHTNATQLIELSSLIKTIPQSTRVVDMEGRMLFWLEGYPVSSLPIDSSLSFVTRRPPPLANYLEQRPAEYIWDGDSGRIAMLDPENIAYIRSHYEPVAPFGEKLWKRK